MMPRSRLPLVALFAAASGVLGCKNDCQQLCHAMADYAAEDCGEEWSKDQLKACMDEQREASEDRLAVCADITDSLREEWTCDDLAVYFD